MHSKGRRRRPLACFREGAQYGEQLIVIAYCIVYTSYTLALAVLLTIARFVLLLKDEKQLAGMGRTGGTVPAVHTSPRKFVTCNGLEVLF